MNSPQWNSSISKTTMTTYSYLIIPIRKTPVKSSPWQFKMILDLRPIGPVEEWKVTDNQKKLALNSMSQSWLMTTIMMLIALWITQFTLFKARDRWLATTLTVLLDTKTLPESLSSNVPSRFCYVQQITNKNLMLVSKLNQNSSLRIEK